MQRPCVTISHLLQTSNTFQAVMVTDGNTSFTLFIYQCGDLQWPGFHSATVGFSAGSEFASNHWLSGNPNITSIACLNTPDNQSYTLIYTLTELGNYGKNCNFKCR